MIKDLIENISADALRISGQASYSSEEIHEKVFEIALQFDTESVLSDEELEDIARKIERRFDVRMTLGTVISEPYQQWFPTAKENIVDWYYWNRYRRYLEKTVRIPEFVVSEGINPVTDSIVGLLENPEKEGAWKRSGLVVGHVQSGKTANYTGVICKAADAGYKVIILLAGIHNNLRNQTQERIEEGFVGVNSKTMLMDVPVSEKMCGVAEYDSERRPHMFTTRMRDFDARRADEYSNLYATTEPAIFVIKKNKNTLENLCDWLDRDDLPGGGIFQLPMLLIDDEADNASINTSRNPQESTTINRLIRSLLHKFDRRCYLGYTATPFANIFISPDNEHDMYGDDLFPKDFIWSLDAPDNYFGPDKVFGENSDLDIVREISLADYATTLPLKHKKEIRPNELPRSLHRAIDVFILSRAARIAREVLQKHNTMLVNVTRFTDLQEHIKNLVIRYLDTAQRAISNHFALPWEQARTNSYVANLREVWNEEFGETELAWEAIQPLLNAAAAPIKVVEVNGSKRSETPVYKDYPDGYSVIAVGGLSLSRGLTLEGLSVSYFLRNSMMYDTLMQMGRWFGYREDYEDLCRIYMPSEAISWYQHIADAIEELREEFVRMKKAQLTPKDFGLAVRSHPDALIVSARNKIRSGKKVLKSISLSNRLIESTVLDTSTDAIESNHSLLRKTISAMSENNKSLDNTNNHLWSNISHEIVKDFVGGFKNHEASLNTQTAPVLNYINFLFEKGTDLWDVALFFVASSNFTANVHDFRIGMLKRNCVLLDGESALRVSGNRSRVGNSSDESIGIDKTDVESVEEDWKDKKSVPGWAYREKRKKPLLVFYIVMPHVSGEPMESISSGLVAYGISFPPATDREQQKKVEYVVNTVWWEKQYEMDLLDEDEEQ